jgi:hypothetical protein
LRPAYAAPTEVVVSAVVAEAQERLQRGERYLAIDLRTESALAASWEAASEVQS